MYFRQPIPMRSARERLLDAAERVVVEAGATHLTLDAVAKSAGISKGGLLYHFPSKESLLEGMMARHFREVDARVAARLAASGGKTSRVDVFRERMRVLLELHPERPAVGAAVVAASAEDPTHMAVARQQYRKLLDEFGKLPGGFERTALVLLAVQGLLLGELLQLSPYTPAERSRLVKAVLRAVDQCGGTP
ncbi:MAG TPA: TetR/AcrR family transcriptional regulator [Steroidobacteraceae bacterium]|jgi:AcrR family transcriptional regulator|nr:TetR/AcrR family transcriptional regulator [Steroidobacteraceae bacterium]